MPLNKDSGHSCMSGKIYFSLIRQDGTLAPYDRMWIKKYIRIAAGKVFIKLSDEEIDSIEQVIFDLAMDKKKGILGYEEFRDCVRKGLKNHPDVLNAYLNSHPDEIKKQFDEICLAMSDIMTEGDKSSGVTDSKLVSSKRSLKLDAIEKTVYKNYVLTDDEREAFDTGYIYIHDMGARRETVNCCLFDMENVLDGGFEMGNVFYEEPKTLPEAFDVIASVVITNAAQIYGGFTVPEIDNLLSKYAKKSFDLYFEKYISLGLSPEKSMEQSKKDLENDFLSGFKSLELKFNTVISARGDYPFITISFGICKDEFAEMACRTAILTREGGQGKDGFKKPVLFPKLVFLFDEELHGDGKKLSQLFDLALRCSSKVMYPEFLSLTGEGYVASMYKKYRKVVSPMCCRAFLSPWYKRGGANPADENDEPIFVGRFNYGVVSLNLPMIFMKAKTENLDFYETLDFYLEMIRNIHKKTYKLLSRQKASSNPVAFTQGGFYGGNLNLDDTIEPLLKSATASFGITALNELQRLFNQKSLYEDGNFSLEVLKYINKKVEEFSKDDDALYTVYGTPAESLCGRQVVQFREKFGVIENVSDREFVSNSFHCHVSEDISPIEKQESESRFWDYVNGGKIQYIRFTNPENVLALKSFVLYAMKLGLYEGINLSISFCNDCGNENYLSHNVDCCTKCGSPNITKIERMCGFLSYTKVHGETRLNPAKMAEIKERKSM